MTTNQYFNNFNASNEQLLVEDLIVESIRMHGMDIMYLPKTLNDFDEIYGEDPIMSFDAAYPVEMYIKNVDGFGGDGDFLSKFNIEVRDQMTLTVARRSFGTAVATPANIKRPNEGDLVYFPLNNKMFRIQYADEKAIFFQFGTLQTWDLTVELYEYSHERFNTGIPLIDAIPDKYSTPAPGSPDEIALDPFEDNTEVQEEADDFIDFTEGNPFGERVY